MVFSDSKNMLVLTQIMWQSRKMSALAVKFKLLLFITKQQQKETNEFQPSALFSTDLNFTANADIVLFHHSWELPALPLCETAAWWGGGTYWRRSCQQCHYIKDTGKIRQRHFSVSGESVLGSTSKGFNTKFLSCNVHRPIFSYLYTVCISIPGQNF